MTAAHVRLVVLTLAGLAAGGLTALTVLPQARERLFPGGNVRSWGEAQIGGRFTLTDHTGRRVTDGDFRGRTMLVLFGSTSCPDASAPALQVVAAALDKLGAEGERFVPVLITVDPEHDTPERLKVYVERFHQRLVGLTGSPAEIAQVLRLYRVDGVRADAGKPAPCAGLNQLSRIYMMGPDGRFVALLDYTVGVDAVAARLSGRS